MTTPRPLPERAQVPDAAAGPDAQPATAAEVLATLPWARVTPPGAASGTTSGGGERPGPAALSPEATLSGVAPPEVAPLEAASTSAGAARGEVPAAGRTPDTPPAAGRPISAWSARSSILLGFAAILILLFGLFGWAWRTNIAGAVVASGQVTASEQRQIVQHPDGGVVSAILVHDGDLVAAGDPLLQLDTAQLETERAVVDGQYFEILARRGRLESETTDADRIRFPDVLAAAAAGDARARELMAGQQAMFAARRRTVAQTRDQQAEQIDQIDAQIDGIAAQIDALTRQAALVGHELADARALLDKGLMQSARVFALEREAAAVDGRLGELAAARAEAEARITEIGVERLRQDAARREAAEAELRDLGYREIELVERREALRERIAAMEIRAPVSGIVHQLQVTTPRSVIRAGEPLMQLVPQDRPLTVAARVATTDIDEIRIGATAVLRFPSFSARTTPEITGIVQQVAADAVEDESGRFAYYPIRLRIPAAERERLGQRTLIPGMPVEVFISTHDRTPLQYLLKPLSDYFSRAMRET